MPRSVVLPKKLVQAMLYVMWKSEYYNNHVSRYTVQTSKQTTRANFNDECFQDC